MRFQIQGGQLVADWFNTPVIQPITERDELVSKVALALQRPDVDVIRLLDTQREAVMASLRQLNRSTRELPETRTTERLLAERRLFELEAQAKWLDRVESLTSPHDSEDQK